MAARRCCRRRRAGCREDGNDFRARFAFEVFRDEFCHFVVQFVTVLVQYEVVGVSVVLFKAQFRRIPELNLLDCVCQSF